MAAVSAAADDDASVVMAFETERKERNDEVAR